jgi:hypothetical protein
MRSGDEVRVSTPVSTRIVAWSKPAISRPNTGSDSRSAAIA